MGYPQERKNLKCSFIPLTRGQRAIVDNEDYDDLIKFNWNAKHYPKKKRWDAQRRMNINGKAYTQMMHRQIMGLLPYEKKCIDHINGDGLDNRKENLRICTNAENCRNRRGPRTGNLSGFKGVSWSSGEWHAVIMVDGKQISIGRFTDKIEAAKARDKASIKYHGEFASLNFPITVAGK